MLRTWWRLPHSLAFAQHCTWNASPQTQKLNVLAIDIFGLLNVLQTQTVCWWKGTVNGANVPLIPNYWRDLDCHPFRWMTLLIYFTQHQFHVRCYIHIWQNGDMWCVVYHLPAHMIGNMSISVIHNESDLVLDYVDNDIWTGVLNWLMNEWNTWWRHQMETFSALMAICAGNSPVPGEFPAQRPVTRSFDVFFDLRPNKRLSKQWWG